MLPVAEFDYEGLYTIHGNGYAIMRAEVEAVIALSTRCVKIK